MTRSEDKAAKIRPLIEHFNNVYQNNAQIVSHQSIDEHMVKFKGNHSMKQYIKNKPIKWGFKMWMRCDAVTGYLYKYDIYTGKKGQPELDVGESVVLDLTKTLSGTGVTTYTDNYFSSPTLVARLLNRGMYFVGIVRKDRKGLLQFKGDNEMHFCKDSHLMALKWIDNKSVHMITSLINSNVGKEGRRGNLKEWIFLESSSIIISIWVVSI